MKSQNKTEVQSEAIDAANKDVFRSVYLGRPLAARIVSRLGPFERWTNERREMFLQLCDVARSVNLQRSQATLSTTLATVYSGSGRFPLMSS